MLIFDEATSSLDNATEQAVMIAHRLATVANCDQIIELERGKVTSIKYGSNSIASII